MVGDLYCTCISQIFAAKIFNVINLLHTAHEL